MKLGEALITRADLHKRLASLRERLQQNIIVQEGDSPSEDPQELISEIETTLGQIEDVAFRVNQANMRSTLGDGSTLTAALAKRDALVAKHAAFSAALKKGQPSDQFTRYSQSEIRWVPALSLADLQRRVDETAAEIRQLNTSIQEANWTIEL